MQYTNNFIGIFDSILNDIFIKIFFRMKCQILKDSSDPIEKFQFNRPFKYNKIVLYFRSQNQINSSPPVVASSSSNFDSYFFIVLNHN